MENRTGLAFLVEPLGKLRQEIVQATISNRLNYLLIDELPEIFALVSSRRPDLVVFVEPFYNEMGPAFRESILASTVTSCLPFLVISQDDLEDSICRYGCVTALAMEMKALLRRERPQAQSGTIFAKGFLLNEESMKLFYKGKSMDLRMSELTLIGPLIDNPDVVFDRSTLAALALGERLVVTENRRLDFYINQFRRRIKTELGVDPIKSLRGEGYAFQGCSLMNTSKAPRSTRN